MKTEAATATDKKAADKKAADKKAADKKAADKKAADKKAADKKAADKKAADKKAADKKAADKKAADKKAADKKAADKKAADKKEADKKTAAKKAAPKKAAPKKTVAKKTAAKKPAAKKAAAKKTAAKKQSRKKQRRRSSGSHKYPSGKPTGLIESTREWLVALHGKAQAGKYYREFHHGDVTLLADSKGIDGQVPEHFRAGTVSGHPSFTALIRNARVWEKNGAVITPDNKLLGDVSRDFDKGLVHSERHPAFRRWHRPPLRRIREPSALLTYVWSGNYFHWLFDVLPRVSLLRNSRWKIRKYVVPRDRHKIQDETLNMLGITKKMRIETDHSFHARFDTLIVPSFVKKVQEHPSEYPRWAAEFLRNEFLRKRVVPASKEYERIFISRANAWQRKLLNERDVLNAIRDYGFRVVELEKLSFKEQVRIFASAKVILASHGAGLANLVFSQPGTKVIEMFPPSYVSNYFWHLSNQMGLDHYYLIGERSVKPHPDWWEGSADFEVDVEKCKELLRFAQI